MKATVVKLLFAGVLISMLSACEHILSPREQRREKALNVATETYRKLIRWGFFEQASKYLKAKEGEVLAPDLSGLSHYKITGYYPSDQQRNDAGDEARVVTLIEYYDLDTGTARTLRDEQYWWYDEPTQHWYLGSSMPDLDKH